MRKKVRYLTHAAIIAALYAVLTHVQNLIFMGSASFISQCRLSEALCILAFFTPAAIPGLSIGCLVFNLTFAGALPLDWLIGTLATLLAALGMYCTRRLTFKGFPFLGLLMPAVTNAFLVGWELSLYLGGAFGFNALSVAWGEVLVMFTLGIALYYAMKVRRLDSRLFH